MMLTRLFRRFVVAGTIGGGLYGASEGHRFIWADESTPREDLNAGRPIKAMLSANCGLIFGAMAGYFMTITSPILISAYVIPATIERITLYTNTRGKI